ncbi:hypothetical protein [Dyella flagellata]|uniref:Uncharacterized protein n=1 Tax=Dyella flagellata TaxID=1867833 RepID=A0ABQ5XCM8_9GAMM|nr:hypothetical protein [Dyella flagellata]GLQ88189.1 hypothetical protein GCM10007898_17580 [Dyella flagellata]
MHRTLSATNLAANQTIPKTAHNAKSLAHARVAPKAENPKKAARHAAEWRLATMPWKLGWNGGMTTFTQ